MEAGQSYAIPLFALIDRGKVEPGKELPESLVEPLRLWLAKECGVASLSGKLVRAEGDAFLVLQGVEAGSLPALCALVDVQRTQLFRYERPNEGTVRLTPVNVRV